MATLKILPLTLEDLDAVVAIEQLSYKSPWAKGFFESEIGSNVAYNFVMKLDETVIGYAGFWISWEYATITKVTIHPALRGKGLSKILLKDLIDRCFALGAESISLEVRESNIVAQGLYTSMGFKKEGKRKGYYEGTEDAIVMILEKEGGSSYEETYIGN